MLPVPLLAVPFMGGKLSSDPAAAEPLVAVPLVAVPLVVGPLVEGPLAAGILGWVVVAAGVSGGLLAVPFVSGLGVSAGSGATSLGGEAEERTLAFTGCSSSKTMEDPPPGGFSTLWKNMNISSQFR